MKSNIEVGIVGIGRTGSEHLNFYSKKKEISKIYISEKKKYKKKLKNTKIIIDPELKIFNKSYKKKLVSISNFDYDHFRYLIKNFNKHHIFVEKPMCYNFKELRKIIQISKKKKYKNLVYSNLVLRGAKIFNDIKKKIYKGEFGKIYYFEADYIYGRLNKIRNGWRGDKNFYSPILGGGIHMVDLMIDFLNEIPSDVITYSNKIVTKKDNFHFDDFFQSNFFFKSKAIAKITTNFGAVHNHQHVVKIFGTKKSFIYDDKGARIFRYRDPYKSKKLNINKLYKGKDCLLPKVFQLIKSKKYYKKENLREINLMSTVLSAVKSNKINAKVKIKQFYD